jgi:membrane protein YdbS with pleckstrin-like domain
VQGPVQRALGVATIHLDVAGRRVNASFKDRDVVEADRLVEDLTVLCRAARSRASDTKGAHGP